MLEVWVLRRPSHKPSDLVWKNKWARLLEMGWGVTPHDPLPASLGLGGNDEWLLTAVFHRLLSNKPKISYLIWLFAVILTWKERFGKSSFQKTANRELPRVCVSLGSRSIRQGTSWKLSLNSPHFSADCISENSYFDSHMGFKSIHFLITVLTFILK